MDQPEGIEWSQAESRTLLQEYENRPLLWSKKHPMHHMSSAKHKAWADIARILGCTTVDVRKKMNSLLASFRRVRAKVKETGRTPWFLYPHMKFLPGFVETNGEDSEDQEQETLELYDDVETQDLSMDSDDTHASEDENLLVKDEPVLEQYELHPNVRAYCAQKHGKKKLTRTIKKRRTYHTNMPETYSKSYVDRKLLEIQRLVKLESNARKKDDCDSYGEYIASTLRKYDSKAQCMLKQAINTLLYEHEMNRFENPLELEMVAEHLDPSDDDN